MSQAVDISKGRSPRYPRIPLFDAIGYARALYDGAHRSAISSDTAYRVMGFNGKNGSSSSALGAVRQFGLVDGLRGDLRISDLALRLLEPSDSNEYEAAVREAALKPEVFAELFIHFDNAIPRSDEPIRSYLIRSMNFSRAGADECILSLRQTMNEADRYSAVPEVNNAEQIDGESVQNKASAQKSPETQPEPVQSVVQSVQLDSAEFVRIPLTRDCNAELRFSGPITSDAINRLIKYIDLMRDVWAEE